MVVNSFWVFLLTAAVPVVWLVMNYVRANVAHGEARFDTKNEKSSNDD
jgi:hypothetical protein